MATLGIVPSIDRWPCHLRTNGGGWHRWPRVLLSTFGRKQRDCRFSKKPSGDLSWEHLFKTVLKDTQARSLRELQACGHRKKLCRSPFSAVIGHWHHRYDKAMSPTCDRSRSTFNFALNGRRFALLVDSPVAEGERHETTHRMRDRRCVTRRKRRPDDRKRATGPGTRVHCGRPPGHRRAGVGEIANRRMVKRRHLPQRQIYRSDWL